MVYTGKERRVGSTDRRKVSKLKYLILCSVFFVIGAAGGGVFRGAESNVPTETGPDPVLMETLMEMQTRVIRLSSMVPDTVIRYVVNDRLRVDTVEVPYTIVEACEPEIVEVEKPVVVYDTTTIYQEAQIQMCPERTFWSKETYKPSIGNTLWSLGGFVLGVVVGGQLDNDARACVVINGEEVCNY